MPQKRLEQVQKQKIIGLNQFQDSGNTSGKNKQDTVELESTTTSDKRPPANNDYHFMYSTNFSFCNTKQPLNQEYQTQNYTRSVTRWKMSPRAAK